MVAKNIDREQQLPVVLTLKAFGDRECSRAYLYRRARTIKGPIVVVAPMTKFRRRRRVAGEIRGPHVDPDLPLAGAYVPPRGTSPAS
jgi:hypothetical protein